LESDLKRWVLFGALLAVLAAVPAGAVQVGIGLAAGVSLPLAQSDNGNGDQYGLRLPVNVLPLLTVEPFLTSTSLGRVARRSSPSSFVCHAATW
jgi:hypothetical protein